MAFLPLTLLVSLAPMQMISGIVLVGFVYFAYRMVYAAYFHPLSHYPGPKLAAITPLLYLYWEISGRAHLWTRSLHDKYGEVVRIGPEILAYRSAQAWKDIYGHRKKGLRLFLKDPSLYVPTPNGTNSIISANEANHARVRRLLAHGFSSKALHEQEPILHNYADLLVQKLYEQVPNMPKAIDLNKWYTFTTFDLIGDLSFGEPFQCLENKQYHWWVTLMPDAVQLSVYTKLLWFFPFLKLVLGLFPLPQYLVERRQASFDLSVDKVTRRLRRQTDRPDFTSYILKHNDDKHGLSAEEIEANAAMLVLAGSETTAALLSGCTYYLLRNPATYARLVDEIRSAFVRYEDITLASINQLTYLKAVLDESLRMYPPIPTILPRLVPEGGAIIAGQYVPEGTSVGLSLWSTFRSSSNFSDPDTFNPERWLVDGGILGDIKEAFQPFSYGPRNCLGQHIANAEMRLILTKVLYSFDMELRPESSGWAQQEAYNLWKRPALWVRLVRAGSLGD